jgi:hypothetical protein
MNIAKQFLLFVIALLLLISCNPNIPLTEGENNFPTPDSKPITPISNETTKESQLATATTTKVFSYIGLEYPPLPEHIVTSSSWGEVIYTSNSASRWSVNIVGDHKNFMLWLSKRTFVDQNGKAHWRVSDIKILPAPKEDLEFIANACLLKGTLDSEIIVLAKIDEATLENRYLLNSNVILAWRANQFTGKIEQIETKGIECYAEGFLIYP